MLRNHHHLQRSNVREMEFSSPTFAHRHSALPSHEARSLDGSPTVQTLATGLRHGRFGALPADGWVQGKSISKWMITRGIPMTMETSRLYIYINMNHTHLWKPPDVLPLRVFKTSLSCPSNEEHTYAYSTMCHCLRGQKSDPIVFQATD